MFLPRLGDVGFCGMWVLCVFSVCLYVCSYVGL